MDLFVSESDNAPVSTSSTRKRLASPIEESEEISIKKVCCDNSLPSSCDKIGEYHLRFTPPACEILGSKICSECSKHYLEPSGTDNNSLQKWNSVPWCRLKKVNDTTYAAECTDPTEWEPSENMIVHVFTRKNEIEERRLLRDNGDGSWIVGWADRKSNSIGAGAGGAGVSFVKASTLTRPTGASYGGGGGKYVSLSADLDGVIIDGKVYDYKEQLKAMFSAKWDATLKKWKCPSHLRGELETFLTHECGFQVNNE